MKNLLLLSFVSIILVTESCQPPDCDRKDCGTCGNACCTLDLTYSNAKTEDIYNSFVASLKAGGADKRYTHIGGSDLRKYNISVDFILQGQHQTLVNRYNDTLDFTFAPVHGVGTEVRAFSISQIFGAYCDAGQNYKNIIGFVKGLGLPYKERHVSGCPMASDKAHT